MKNHMCRSIKVLRRPEDPVTEEEIAAAALQFVRKVSGFRKPSKANQASFDGAVEEVAQATQRLLQVLAENAPARPRPASPSQENAVLGEPEIYLRAVAARTFRMTRR